MLDLEFVVFSQDQIRHMSITTIRDWEFDGESFNM
jgi:hypothetical protein